MLYQVALQKGYKGSRSFPNSVNEFAKVLRASGGYVKSGSPTAISTTNVRNFRILMLFLQL